MRTPFKEVKPTHDQQQALDVGMVAFMEAAPFYAYLFHSLGDMVVTRDIDTLATNGKHIAINPDYFAKLKPMERVFTLAHEMSHLVCKHSRRFTNYKKAGSIKGKPVDAMFANMCMDLIINADLVESNIGRCNPDWLYDPAIKADMLWEDLYERLYPTPPPGQKPPPQRGQGQPEKPCNDGEGGEDQGEDEPQDKPQKPGEGVRPDKPPKLRRDAPGALKGQQGDPEAAANDGMFDELLEPYEDPVTGEADEPDENEFREAIARAAAAAKSIGKFSDNMKRLVDEVLTPQVSWRDHIRLAVTGSIGTARETWARPNRRRLALNPIVIMPGRRGNGCDLVAIGVDTSGSVGGAELRMFFSEISGILQDVKPKRIVIIGCDHDVTQTDDVTTMNDFDGVRAKGIRGGGGTRFSPVFEYLEKNQLRPDTLVYLTDGYGPAARDPGYPVIWCLSPGGQDQPWGEHVRMS
jgi:predicted metal-dependent peptidase